MVTAAIRNYGRLDFAHNNAGIPGAGATVPDTSIDDWRRAIDVMLTGVFLGLKYEIPRILEHGQGGAIVNTSSGAGLIGFPGMCGYVASKHAVAGLTKALRDAGVAVVSSRPAPRGPAPKYTADRMVAEHVSAVYETLERPRRLRFAS